MILVNVLKEVIDSMSMFVNFVPGTNSQILKELILNDESITYKDKKYPLFAVVLPAPEVHGSCFYADIKIPRIVIATYNDSQEPVLSRFNDNGTFNSILYPVYDEFLIKLARSKYINCSDPEQFKHTKFDNPGEQQVGRGTNDFIDSMEIMNLEFTLLKIKTC